MKTRRSIDIKIFITALLLLAIQVVKSQIVCADVEIVPNSGEQTDFVFDSFGKYIAGVTFNGAVKVKVKVDDKVPPDPNCKWMLTMSVENNSSSGSAADEWETLTSYGTGNANIPKIDILGVRITNGCSTSPIDGVYQNFVQTGDIIDIIENTGVRVDAGSCTVNVNGPGSYLTYYDEFTFQIDFRIIPGFDNEPGMYQLQVKFELVEVP